MLDIILILFVLDKKLLGIAADDKPFNGSDNVIYLQALCLTNQVGGPTATAVALNSIDGMNGITLFGNGTFYCKKPGIFFAVFATQIGSPKGNGEGDVHIWTRGVQDYPYSNSMQSVERGSMSVLIYQVVFQIFDPGVVTLMFSVVPKDKISSLGLIATAPRNEPVVPSAILSIIQLSDGNNIIPYGELISTETQLGYLTAKAITLSSSSGNTGIDTTTTAEDGTIKFNRSGLYFVMTSAQVGSTTNTYAAGEVHLWMGLNGKDIPNSNTIQTINNGSTGVVVSQTIATFKANDKVTLLFSTTNKNLGLITTTPKNEPTVPSMLFSIFRLNNKKDLMPYAQLSDSTSQWGNLTPNGVRLGNNDGLYQITNNNGVLRFNESGTYFLMAAAQVGSYGGLGSGDVHFWMRLNGQDMANSNTIQTINGDNKVLISQTVTVIQTGDKIEMMFSAVVTKGKLGLVAIQPQHEPTVPSMTFSAFKSTY